MPTPVVLRLSRSSKGQLAHRAKEAGVPLGLWARCAIEAARHVDDVAMQIDIDASKVVIELDHIAVSWRDQAVTTTAARRQIQYVRALRRGDQTVPLEDSTSPVTTMVMDNMVSGWTQAASATGCALDAWAERQLGHAPRDPHLWEAAAAQAGRSLGEWIYAITLARFRPH